MRIKSLLSTTVTVAILSPTNVGFFVLICALSLVASSTGARIIDRNTFAAIILLCIAILGTFAGLYLGTLESQTFFVRVFCCLSVFLAASLTIRRNQNEVFLSILAGFLVASVINALFVVSTAFYPSLYDTLHIASYSGFDKSNRMFRSPGLMRGFDTSGLLVLFGLSIAAYKNSRREMRPVLYSSLILLFICSIAFSSRTSMIAFAMVAATIVFFRHKETPFAALVILIAGLIAAATSGFILGGLVFAPDLVAPFVDKYVDPDFISSLYNIGDPEDYTSHFSMAEYFKILPEEQFVLPDNFLFRSMGSLGVLGSAALLAPMLWIIMLSVSTHRGSGRDLAVRVAIIYIAGNFKNNYVFYVPFFLLVASIFLARPRSCCANPVKDSFRKPGVVAGRESGAQPSADRMSSQKYLSPRNSPKPGDGIGQAGDSR